MPWTPTNGPPSRRIWIDCESCSREVVEFSETSAELARLVAMAPPRAIRGSMLSAIRSVRPLPPLTDEAPSAPELVEAELGPGPGSDAFDEPVRRAGPPTMLAARRSARGSRRNRVLTGLIAAAAVVALALGGFVYSLNQQRQARLRRADRRERGRTSC